MDEPSDHLKEWAELVGDSIPEVVSEDDRRPCDEAFGAEPSTRTTRTHQN